MVRMFIQSLLIQNTVYSFESGRKISYLVFKLIIIYHYTNALSKILKILIHMKN